MLRDITKRKLSELDLKKSEEKYRHLFESSPFAIIIFDLKGVIIDCNSVTEKLFRCEKKDIIGKNYLEHPNITPENISQMKDRFMSLIQGEEVEPLDLQVLNADGHTLWINSKISKIVIGNQVFFYSIIQDITNKKILENIMFELNQNFFNFTTDVQGNIHLLLKTVSKISRGKVVLYARRLSHNGKDVVQILTSEKEKINIGIDNFQQDFFISKIYDQSHELPQIFTNINKNKDYSADIFIQRYQISGGYGKIINLEENVKSATLILYEAEPEITYEEQFILLLVSDAIAIEEQRLEILQKLEEQNRKLSEIDKLKSDFLRRISHELKTPLISIKGYSELILEQNREYFDIDTLSMIGEIKQGCLRLENLIKELLKSSELETGRIELNRTLEDLSFLLKFTVRELQGLAKTRNQQIILDVHDNLFTMLEKERIHEVIGNLISNAIKYTPPYGKITIKTEVKEDFFIVSVKDNGIGFTDSEKAKLFQKFGKIEHYGRGSYIATDGTGLGLYIAKKLVELHGGKIWMESEGRDKGSTFYFSLPIIKN
jgi:PAS domain S-box-containing protein